MRSDVTFKDERGRKYKWRGNAPGCRLEVRTALHPIIDRPTTHADHPETPPPAHWQLFAEDDGFKAPIAKFARSRKDHATGTTTPATLTLTARALELRDDVVCSFLFLEKTRRVNETTSQRSADVLATPALSALTGHDYNVSNGGVP